MWQLRIKISNIRRILFYNFVSTSGTKIMLKGEIGRLEVKKEKIMLIMRKCERKR